MLIFGNSDLKTQRKSDLRPQLNIRNLWFFMATLLSGGYLHAEPLIEWPLDFEVAGSESVGLGQGGQMVSVGTAALRNNPSMLAVEPKYQVDAGYYWAGRGRDFYQGGIVDARTSSYAAGVAYTGFLEDYEPLLRNQSLEEDLAKLQAGESVDITLVSPVNRRVSFGAARLFGGVALGLSGQYVLGYIKGSDGSLVERQGVSLGAGLSSLVYEDLRLGVSVENLVNKGAARLAPRVLRVGMAYQVLGGLGALSVDYAYRDGLTDFVAGCARDRQRPNSCRTINIEKNRLVVVAMKARVYELVYLMGGYGWSLDGAQERYSAGILVKGQGVDLAYTLKTPFGEQGTFDQSLGLSISVQI